MGSNPTGCMSWVFCVLSGRSLCDELITRPGESYRLWCVVVCDLETKWLGGPDPLGGWGCCAKRKMQIRIFNVPSNRGLGSLLFYQLENLPQLWLLLKLWVEEIDSFHTSVSWWVLRSASDSLSYVICRGIWMVRAFSLNSGVSGWDIAILYMQLDLDIYYVPAAEDTGKVPCE